jgi:hypothetical protein
MRDFSGYLKIVTGFKLLSSFLNINFQKSLPLKFVLCKKKANKSKPLPIILITALFINFSLFIYFGVLRQGGLELARYPRLGWNSQFSCLRPLRVRLWACSSMPGLYSLLVDTSTYPQCNDNWYSQQ